MTHSQWPSEEQRGTGRPGQGPRSEPHALRAPDTLRDKVGRVQGATRTRSVVTTVGLLVVVATAGCGRQETVNAADLRQADVYAAIIESMVERPNDPVAPTIYVEGLDGAQIPVEVQAKVIAATDGKATVRFIDDRNEAIDNSAPGAPVKPDAMLVALGPVPRTSPTRVAVAHYLAADNVTVLEFTATVNSAGHYTVAPGTAPE